MFYNNHTISKVSKIKKKVITEIIRTVPERWITSNCTSNNVLIWRYPIFFLETRTYSLFKITVFSFFQFICLLLVEVIHSWCIRNCKILLDLIGPVKFGHLEIFRLLMFIISSCYFSFSHPFKSILYVGYFWNVTYIYSFHKYLFTVRCQLNVVGFIGINMVSAFKEFALTYVDELYLSV